LKADSHNGKVRAAAKLHSALLATIICLSVIIHSGYVIDCPTGVDFQQKIIHELGHALLLHHSTKPEDVMYPDIDKTVKITQDSIDQLKKVWGL
jgi:predicted Zn-dependent protease